MCRVLRFALLGALLVVPLAVAEPAKSSPASSPLTFSPASEAVFQTCILGQTGCCVPLFNNCSDQDTSISFVNQKPNTVCVYVCQFTRTCTASNNCPGGPAISYGSFRVRSSPGEYPLGGCPAANLSFCTTMTVDP